MKPLKTPISNSYWVADGFLAGPVPSRRELVALCAQGDTLVVNLMADGEPGSGYSAEGLPLTIKRMPINDFAVPLEATMVQILDEIDASRVGGRQVYVHCRAGIGRTGTVVGCWLVRHGTPPEDAFDEIAIRRIDLSRLGSSPETPQQRQFLVQWKSDK